MVLAAQITAGMTLSIGGKLFRVESSVKVAPKKGDAFMKVKIRSLITDKMVEKNFKLDQKIKDVALSERDLEFLYMEGKGYLFLDVDQLEMVSVAPEVVGESVHFLKEGTALKATFFGDSVSSVEFPQFLELMVAQAEESEESGVSVSDVTKQAVLETGASVAVPLFIEVGDIVKVDTRTGEFVQRV